ncbi:f-box domain-containing [Trichoderma cornu-damae]|uniref:F-box domain-containing n=1 Tax=Trichoderma cornu-damae TaxID=654480 RepID=A0A9P8QNN6_9HYPO|nr:f-box domain-containing [Trichoderma cornu-damae]
MLKQGGWWSSMTSILPPMKSAPAISNLRRESIMSKWISRECSLLSPHKPAFVEAGYTDFSAAVPGSKPGDLRGAMAFTASLCGRFVMATHGRVVYVYELNHNRHTESCIDDGPLERWARRIFRIGSVIPSARKCVAFGCSAGIELHWVDAMTGQDLSRWFPLTSPSDFLYFLPPRRGVDTPRKMRLISSATGLDSPMDFLDDVVHDFGTLLMRPGSTAMASRLASDPWHMRRGRGISLESGGSSQDVDMGQDEDLLSRNVPQDSPLRRLAAASADHFRAVPLSDGYHILFTDPRTGTLCLGTDAPVGSLTRLLRKIWFRPPPQADPPVPLLYAAGADTRHGVRVVATFAARRRDDGASSPERRRRCRRRSYGAGIATPGDGDSNEQLIVFYTVPPDVFHDMRRTDADSRSAGYRTEEDQEPGRPEPRYGHFDVFGDPFGEGSSYPLEIDGHLVANCGNITEIALNSCPDLIIWAFAAEGWAKTWVLDTGRSEPPMRAAAQRDGSVRHVDSDGDVVMTDPCIPSSSSSVTSSLDLNLFDGAPICAPGREPTTKQPQYRDKRRHVRGQV